MTRKRPVLELSQPLTYDANGSDLQVSGFSVHTGRYQNGSVEIPSSELSNVAKSLVGKQLRKDHKFSVDSIVGKITDTKLAMDDKTKSQGVKYQGFVADKELATKIQKGLITNVSIGFGLTPICSTCGEDFRDCQHDFSNAHVVARDVACDEQSFVAQGADGNSTVEPGAHFDSNISDFQMQFGYDKIAFAIQKNGSGYSNASSLIDSGKYDSTSPWSFSRSTDGKKLLGPNGDDWANYSKWFLATNSSATKNTEAYYKYPFGKDGKVYKSALNAIRQRAGQQHATEIFDMAGTLLDKIASKTQQSEHNKGGNTMSEEQKGEKINFAEIFEKLGETQRTLAQKEQELSTSKEDKESLNSEISQLKEEISSSKQQLEDAMSAKDDLISELKDTKEALTQKELAGKKAEAEELANEYVEKGLIKKENFDAKVESLIKLDSVGIEEAKDLLSKINKPTSQKEKIDKYNNFDDEMKDEDKVKFEDLDEKTKTQAAIMDFFGYQEFFPLTNEYVEGYSFMGLDGLKKYKKVI